MQCNVAEQVSTTLSGFNVARLALLGRAEEKGVMEQVSYIANVSSHCPVSSQMRSRLCHFLNVRSSLGASPHLGWWPVVVALWLHM
jgi:hypothetical protein